MRVLFLSCWWPYPAVNGSKIRIYNLLRQLAKRHEVTLLSFVESGEGKPEDIDYLRTFCRHVEAIPEPHPNPGRLQTLQGYLSPWPRSLVYNYSLTMAGRVNEIVNSGQAGMVIGSQVDMLRYLEQASCHVPTLLEEVELTMYHDSLQTAPGIAHRLRARMTLAKLENGLRLSFARHTAATVVSTAEYNLVRRIAPPDTCIEVIPNGVDTGLHRPVSAAPKPYTLVYPGSVSYQPNYEAVRYFVEDVLPLVRRRFPQVSFTVTGSTGDADISALAAAPGVHFTGFVESIDELVGSSWALVVPLRSGGGTRLKILEAMALGTAVVSTRKGAEGLDVHPGEDILIADSPEAMAQTLCDLFEDAAARQRIGQNGRRLVEQVYDWNIIGSRFLDMIDTVARKYPNGH